MSLDDPKTSNADPANADPANADLRDDGYTRQAEDGAGSEGTDKATAGSGDAPEASLKVPAGLEARGRGAIRWMRVIWLIVALVGVLVAAAFFAERHYLRSAMREDLPQLDGTLTVNGLVAPVTVERDAQGVPHIRASSMDDLVFAQGYVTAEDRLWQMDILRREASGELAAILGRSMLEHDRVQRTLQIGAAADKAITALPADQKHWLEEYARGVNASIAAQLGHLPVEFRVLGYQPAQWTPRDSILVELAMFQELTTGFPEKLNREALAAHLSPELMADLYPTGSWRDHYPGQPMPDVSAPQPIFEDVPLDESQSKLHPPAGSGTPSIPRSMRNGLDSSSVLPASDLMALEQTLALFNAPCDACVAGSNAWAVSGTRTASGKPLLSNDMHLDLSVPELWYEADLEASNTAPMAGFHAAGVTLPGTPFVIAGHNDHVAWGFANLGADVQDLYIEHTRGAPSGAEYQTPGGGWNPVQYRTEIIHVRGGSDVILDVPLTRHGGIDTPIITSIFPDSNDKRFISLLWSIYDSANVTAPFYAVDSASDWTTMLAAFSGWGGPAQSLIYADDQGNIGYHALGRIPIRGDANNPSPLSPVPTDATAPDAAAHEWAGYIPFDQLPQAFDPPDGVLAAANARVTPDGSRYPITLDWMAPYRTERIYKVLESSPRRALEAAPGSALQSSSGKGSEAVPGDTLAPSRPLTTEDMLGLENDVYSQLDLVIAERLAYSIDHSLGPLKNDKQLIQAANLLRQWNGSVDSNAAAPAIVKAFRTVFWPMLLIPKLAPQAALPLAQGVDLSKIKGLSADSAHNAGLWQLYSWGERDSVEEEIITHTPARWLPRGYGTWDDFLATAVQHGLQNAHAPRDLSAWQQGIANPLDIEHPIFSHAPLLARLLLGVPTGTGPRPKSGDHTTVKQVGRAFGPSERFTTDLSDFDHTTLNLVLGESGNPDSPWYMDQFQSWLNGSTYPLPFTPAATQPSIVHRLTLTPR